MDGKTFILTAFLAIGFGTLSTWGAAWVVGRLWPKREREILPPPQQAAERTAYRFKVGQDAK